MNVRMQRLVGLACFFLGALWAANFLSWVVTKTWAPGLVVAIVLLVNGVSAGTFLLAGRLLFRSQVIARPAPSGQSARVEPMGALPTTVSMQRLVGSACFLLGTVWAAGFLLVLVTKMLSLSPVVGVVLLLYGASAATFFRAGSMLFRRG